MVDAQTPGENKTPSDKRLKDIWHGMISRCEHGGVRNYARYGARGITVCDEWHDYDTFSGWAISHGYADGLTIDRIHNDKGYGPDNCRWATPREQANNRTTNRHITVGDVTMTHSQWAREIGVAPSAISAAIRRGIDPVEYIRRHLDEGHGRKVCCSAGAATITVDGETHSVRRWAEIIGVTPGIVYRTIREGRDPVEYIRAHLGAGYARRVYGDTSHPTTRYSRSDAA